MGEKSLGEFIQGGREVKLKSYEKPVFVQELSLETLLPFAEQVLRLKIVKEAVDWLIDALSGQGKGKKFDQRVLTDMLLRAVPDFLALVGLLGKLCGQDENWFKRLPLADELTIIKTVFEVSDFENVVPCFFDVCRMISNIETTIQPAGTEASGS